MINNDPSLIIERRYIVYGHKYGKPFRESGAVYGDPQRYLGQYQARIDNPPVESWQPTITALEIVERVITPYRITQTIGVIDECYSKPPFVSSKTNT